MEEQTKQLQEKMIKKILSLECRNKLKDAENKMLHDEEALRLISVFHHDEDDYNFYLKSFGENHEFTLKAKKQLFHSKLEMDNYYLIREYNKTLKEVNEPLRYLSLNLINLFSRGKEKC